MYSQNTALGSDRWPPIKNLLLQLAALTAIALSMQCGCGKSARSFQEMTQEEQLDYLRAQASTAMLVQATNGIPHFHEVIEENADTYSGSVGQWRGWVRLDYVGQAGALEQTNIPLNFIATYDGRLMSVAATASSGPPLLNLQ